MTLMSRCRRDGVANPVTSMCRYDPEPAKMRSVRFDSGTISTALAGGSGGEMGAVVTGNQLLETFTNLNSRRRRQDMRCKFVTREASGGLRYATTRAKDEHI